MYQNTIFRKGLNLYHKIDTSFGIFGWGRKLWDLLLTSIIWNFLCSSVMIMEWTENPKLTIFTDHFTSIPYLDPFHYYISKWLPFSNKLGKRLVLPKQYVLSDCLQPSIAVSGYFREVKGSAQKIILINSPPSGLRFTVTLTCLFLENNRNYSSIDSRMWL